jgi:hypothetical protein
MFLALLFSMKSHVPKINFDWLNVSKCIKVFNDFKKYSKFEKF